MTDRIQELIVFVRAAESGSFSLTARELGLSQPSVSRLVAGLEARLGVKLLLRTTRRIVPTDAGLVFLDRARQVLHDLEAAEEAARGTDSLRGILRVAMPVAFGVRVVVPALTSFLAAHPLLRVELMMSDGRQDLVAEGADVAFRLGKLTDSSFVARKLAVSPRLVIAAPGYLRARGVPTALAERAEHDCIFGPGASSRQSWTFARDGDSVSVDVKSRLQVAAADGMIACVKAGLGIAIASAWLCSADLASGAVVQILADHALAPVEVHAVFPGGANPPSKARALVDHMAAALRKPGQDDVVAPLAARTSA